MKTFFRIIKILTSKKVISAVRSQTIKLNILKGVLYSDELNSLHLQMYLSDNEMFFV
ncbi:hypothetical protein SGQ44_04375 [Flavobacterium sp. Fl-77]|uniref:Uncharacterized protein n=1 Tax=Flavobacterium flavipigmentatum TaxID=2893884 RepID=A0AAJ2W0C7_9FLAO|nr:MULTISPECIES: hypothetical protein [unclassified Flavobacterium]MDX6181373.1 hypothetical protein [Flavobacterium sp. Fl-33]MDX6184975.1 hypothetical protein [Flavobacterium sp. Fl-77]UFH40067.1 hypothetical protein LNP22_07270 [Flavobacterium sp. F-70]